MLRNERVLRVLDLSHTRISTLPEFMGDLKFLRFLNLSSTRLEQVPKCVRKLKSLSFLDVSNCSALRSLPLWIGELVSLQHLNAGHRSIPKEVSKLLSLSTLRSDSWRLSVENNRCLGVEDVGKMPCLQELSIQVESTEATRRLARGVLGRSEKMRTLQLWYGRRLEQVPLPETIKAMKDLQRLDLDGNFAVPGWIRGFENLRVLHFVGCDCSHLYPDLETMSNLTVLIVRYDSFCRVLPTAFGKRGGFPNLRVFCISHFYSLEELPEMEDGAMASLETLKVWSCPRVINVPRGFQGLKRLREFWFRDSGTDECRLKLKEEWGTVAMKKRLFDNID